MASICDIENNFDSNFPNPGNCRSLVVVDRGRETHLQATNNGNLIFQTSKVE